MSSLSVSIIIANHNLGHWVMDAVHSAINDPYGSKRIVVFDDGSTDGSMDILLSNLKEYHATDRFVRGLVKGTNVPLIVGGSQLPLGPSAARNAAMLAVWAETDVFAILDADDLFLPGKLRKCVAKIAEARGEVGVVYGDYDTFSESRPYVAREYKEPYSRERLLRECIVHSACVIDRGALEVVGLYDEKLRVVEDYDLWLRLSERFIITHIPEPLMRVRVGRHSSTDTVKSDVWQACWRRVQEKVMERARGEG